MVLKFMDQGIYSKVFPKNTTVLLWLISKIPYMSKGEG